MKKKHIFILFLTVIFLNMNIFAATATYSTENYTIAITYNEIVTPGDAVFVKMGISPAKSMKESFDETPKRAVLQLLKDKKNIESAPFYELPKLKNQTYTEYLASIPVSIWLQEDNYSLRVTLSTANVDNLDFYLPITYESREFNSETIELNEKNTLLKTDNSPERIAQIEKLNNILFTTMLTDVYSLKPFEKPTDSDNYTAYFGDKRIYVFTNGKDTSNVHYGNDYGIPNGTLVKTCAAGKVVMAENRISTGWSIVIEHLPGLYSLYYHLSELGVKEGDIVKAGDLIGKSGDTGLATGPHLHWEVRLNGSAVRPEFFLNNFTFETEPVEEKKVITK